MIAYLFIAVGSILSLVMFFNPAILAAASTAALAATIIGVVITTGVKIFDLVDEHYDYKFTRAIRDFFTKLTTPRPRNEVELRAIPQQRTSHTTSRLQQALRTETPPCTFRTETRVIHNPNPVTQRREQYLPVKRSLPQPVPSNVYSQASYAPLYRAPVYPRNCRQSMHASTPVYIHTQNRIVLGS